MIPEVDIASLFAGESPARAAADRAVLQAACSSGFMVVSGLPGEIPLGAGARAQLLRLFSLSEEQKRRLARQKFEPGNPNVYRGYFPTQDGQATYKEGIDIGPDAVDPGRCAAGDPLREPTPLPDAALLPGWRTAVAAYYGSLERVGSVLMRSLARGLALPEETFDPFFQDGISTLRLIRYPVRPPESVAGLADEEITVVEGGARRQVVGKAHVDSGFVTLLQQDGVGGLQARLADGNWHDVPPREEGLAVNFGKLLERWTAGRIKATEHRVLGGAGERCSIPFFYEPRADARIEPLPLAGAPQFEPFTYGDHLWAAMTRFVEFQGLEHLRPQGA